MTVDSLFHNSISRLRRQIILRRIKWTFAAGFLLWLTFILIALAAQEKGLIHLEIYVTYSLLGLLAFAMLAIYMLRIKKTFMNDLIEIDTRLGLKERLSTAYEYHQLDRKSIFVDLLKIDATNRLTNIKIRQALPRPISMTLFLVPLLCLPRYPFPKLLKLVIHAALLALHFVS